MEVAPDSLRRAKPLLGTFVEIAVAGAALPDMERALEAAFAAIARVHRLMSFHGGDSDVSRLNRAASARPVVVDPWTYAVLHAAADLHRRSHGRFDITIAPALQRLGLLPRHDDDGLHDDELPWPSDCRDCVELMPDHHVRFLYSNVRIDLGGIAKGFAVDRAADVLEQFGMRQGLVNAGGDLATFGPSAHAVHIRHPIDAQAVLCRVEVHNGGALASSGGYFDPALSRHVARTAVVDPRSGERQQGAAGASVQASSCMMADALTKVVMLAGESADPVLTHYGAGALMVSAEGDVSASAGWQAWTSRAA